MKLISSLLLFALLLVTSTGVLAQDEEEAEKDLLEVSIFGGLAVPSGGLSDWVSETPEGKVQLGTNTGYKVGFDIGYFVTSNMVVGGSFGFSQFSVKSDSVEVASMNHRIISPAAYMKYFFFGESNFVPYIKGQVGIDILKFVTRLNDPNDRNKYRELTYNPALSFGVGVGFLYYTHDYGGLFLEANYQNGLTKDAEAKTINSTFGETAAVIDIHAGIVVFFGSDE